MKEKSKSKVIRQRDRTYEELLYDALTRAKKTAAEYIPQLCDSLKIEHTDWNKEEIKRKVIDDCKDVWAFNTIDNYWPIWMKDLKQEEGHRQGWETRRQKQQQFKPQPKMSGNQIEQPTITDEFTEVLNSNKTRYDAIDVLVENLSGLLFHEQRYGKHELVSDTKAHRFKIIKQLSDYDLKMTYGKSEKLYLLLDDFIKQLDKEFDLRHQKRDLVSE